MYNFYIRLCLITPPKERNFICIIDCIKMYKCKFFTLGYIRRPYNTSSHVFLNLSALWLLQYSNIYLEWVARVLHDIKSLPQPVDSNSYTAFVHCCIEYIFCKRKHNHIILELHYIILGFKKKKNFLIKSSHVCMAT